MGDQREGEINVFPHRTRNIYLIHWNLCKSPEKRKYSGILLNMWGCWRSNKIGSMFRGFMSVLKEDKK